MPAAVHFRPKSLMYEAWDGEDTPVNLGETWWANACHVSASVPANFLPGLLNRESLERIKEARREVFQEYGISINPIPYKSYLKFEGTSTFWLPWDVFLGFTYKGLHIAAPNFVSFDHRILSCTTVSDEERKAAKELVIHHLDELVRDWPMVILSMPQRQEGSSTHELLTIWFGAKTHDVLLPQRISTRYYLRGLKTTQEEFTCLFEDPVLRGICLLLSNAWSENFAREIAKYQQPEFDVSADTLAKLIPGLSFNRHES